MSNINDGGSAFPRFPVMMKNQDGTITKQEPGMTLRDYFAAKAMQGLLSGLYSETSKYNLDDMPCEAYEIADAMLRAREAT